MFNENALVSKQQPAGISSGQATNILRLPAVKARTGLSRSTIYHQISVCLFPKPINLGMRAVGWLESDIDSWLISRVKESRCLVVSNNREGVQS